MIPRVKSRVCLSMVLKENSGKERVITMKNRFVIESFQWDRHHDQMDDLYLQISGKYPGGMYWSYDPNFCSWDNTFVLLDTEKINENGIGKVIGKAQVMYYHKLEDTVPVDVKQRVIYHYRVVPEYEEMPEAVETLFAVIEERAKELTREVTPGRKSVLCQSCTDEETFYIRHIQEKGYAERTGYYCMSVKKGEEKLGEPVLAEGIELRNITKEFSSYKDCILRLDHQCFSDDAMSVDEFDELAEEENLIVLGAFANEELAGLAIGCRSSEDAPEVVSLNVAKEYRRKGIAKYLVTTLLRELKKFDAEEITLAVKNDNLPAIALYRSIGFTEYRNERMFGKEMNTQEQLIHKAAEIIRNNRDTVGYCSLTLMDTDGRPMTTTITPSKSEGIRWITFCTGYGTRTERIEFCKDACVCFNSSEYHIALKGSMEIITDLEVKREMWYDGLTNHFTGPEDPGYVVLKFVADSYSLFIDWQSVRGTL